MVSSKKPPSPFVSRRPSAATLATSDPSPGHRNAMNRWTSENLWYQIIRNNNHRPRTIVCLQNFKVIEYIEPYEHGKCVASTVEQNIESEFWQHSNSIEDQESISTELYVRRSKHGTGSMVIGLGGIAPQGPLSLPAGNRTFLKVTAAEYNISAYHLLTLAHMAFPSKNGLPSHIIYAYSMHIYIFIYIYIVNVMCNI